MAASGGNTLRAVLKELGWSRTRLVAELRRQAASSGESLPGTESVIAMVSRWVNNHQQPSDFYRDLLARTLGRPRAELFSDEAARLELAAEAEPWLLAQALEHFRDVTHLLDGPLPVARRGRLAVVAGHLAGLAGSLAFDLRDEGKALAYFKVAVQAADDAGSPDLAAWALATRSLIPTYTGDPGAALRLLQESQDRARGHVSPSRLAWLAALEARAHAGLGDAPPAWPPSAGLTMPSSVPSRPVAGSPTTSSTGRGWPASEAPATCSSARPKPPRQPWPTSSRCATRPTSRAVPWPASTWPRPTSRTAPSRRRARPSPTPWPSATRTASGRSSAAPVRSAPHWSHGAKNNRSRSWTSSCVRCCPPDSPGLGRPRVA